MSLLNIIKKGSVNRSITLRIINSTTGAPETGVVFDSAGIDLWYRRESAAVTSITEVTLAALTTAHTDGGFLHISNEVYRFDIPDAAFADGVNLVEFGGTVTGMIVIGGEIKLVDYDPEDPVRMGLTALPDAAADAAGGLAISDAGNLDLDALAVNTDLSLIATGTAQAATNTTLQLSAAENFPDDLIIGSTVVIISGATGTGQSRIITGYAGATDTATVDAWTITPTGTINYAIFATPPASTASPAPVNVIQWLSTAPAAPNIAGIPKVDSLHINGGRVYGNGTNIPWGAE